MKSDVMSFVVDLFSFETKVMEFKLNPQSVLCIFLKILKT